MPRPLTRQQLTRQVWTMMQDFVLAEDRTRELRGTLGLGRGTGRVKVLLSLAQGARSLGDLAAATGADRPYTTLIVNELEARGLITRTRDPDNRRRKLVALTDSGHVAVNSAREIITRPPAPLHALSKQELTQLSDALSRLNE
jgi:DNA-binding MarR family transcriptional regulator